MVGKITKLLRSAVARVRPDGASRKKFPLPGDVEALVPGKRRHLDELVSLGALMKKVAHVDEDYDPQEEKVIRKILVNKGGLGEKDTVLVMAAARETKANSMDLHGLTKEFRQHSYKERIHVLDLLFQVADAEGRRKNLVLEKIRKISKLLGGAHKDFSDSKIRVRAQN